MKRVNKSIMVFAVLIMLIGTACAGAGDEQWNRTYGGAFMDYAYSVWQTSDGGYVIAGETQSYSKLGEYDTDFWLVKTDSNGVEQWNNSYGSGEYPPDSAWSVQQTSDGGYILTGETRSYGAGEDDIWLIKTGSGGTEVWNKTFGGIYDDGAYFVQQTSDGGYILAGATESFGVGYSKDAWLIKTDSSGTEIWNKTFGGASYDSAQEVQQTTDGGYILVGYTESYDVGGGDVWLIKTDPNGIEEWNTTFGNIHYNEGWSVQQTSDGGYIIAGETRLVLFGDKDFWLIKTDSGGIEEWDKTIGGAGYDLAFSVQQTSDNGYVLTGVTSSYGAGSDDIWLVKTDSGGIEQWNRTFGGTGDDLAYSVRQTTNNGYILAGTTWSFGVGYDDFWLIRVYGEEPTPPSTSTPTRRKGTMIEGAMMEEVNLIPELIQPTQPPLQLPIQLPQGSPLQYIMNLDLIVIIVSCILLQKYYRELHVQYPVLIGLSIFVAITIITKFYILNWALGNPSDILRYGSLPIYCLAGFTIVPAEERGATVKNNKKIRRNIRR